MMTTIRIVLAAMLLLLVSLPGQEVAKQPENVRELIETLRKTEGVYTWPVFGRSLDWVKDSDIPFLIGLLDSDRECAHVVLPISSDLPMLRSTVGHQAAYLIEGYWKRFHPVRLSSDNFEPNLDEIGVWYRTWQKLRKVERLRRAAPRAPGGTQ